nr:hypothetical protein GCM10020092_005170 [Actinoplanes digitatis]
MAYADDEQRVHLVPTGIPAAALTVIDSTVQADGADWSGSWWLSKPAAAWQLNFRDLGGAVIRTVSGSSARGLLKADWDGKDSTGKAVADAGFTWSLTAQPADGQGAALTVEGAVSAPATLKSTRKPSITGASAVGSTVKADAGCLDAEPPPRTPTGGRRTASRSRARPARRTPSHPRCSASA